jgi:hypothetical protein
MTEDLQTLGISVHAIHISTQTEHTRAKGFPCLTQRRLRRTCLVTRKHGLADFIRIGVASKMDPKIDKNVAKSIGVYVNDILRKASAKMNEEDFFFIEMRADALMDYVYNNSITEEEREAEDILNEQESNYFKDLGV